MVGTTEVAGDRQDRRTSMIERMTMIVRAFETPQSCLNGGDIASASGLPRSTTHRIIDEMIRFGWLRRVQDGYMLGGGILSAREPTDRFRLRVAAAPLLQALADETGLVAHLCVEDGAHVVVLDKIGGTGAASVPTRVGARLPLHATAAGKAILASHEPEIVDRLLPATLVKRTAWTIPTRTELHLELHRTRRRGGIGHAREEAFVGISGAAKAFRNSDGTHSALTLTGRIRPNALDRLGPMLTEATRRVVAGMSNEGGGEPQRSISSTKRVPDAMMIKLLGSVHAGDWV